MNKQEETTNLPDNPKFSPITNEAIEQLIEQQLAKYTQSSNYLNTAESQTIDPSILSGLLVKDLSDKLYDLISKGQKQSALSHQNIDKLRKYIYELEFAVDKDYTDPKLQLTIDNKVFVLSENGLTDNDYKNATIEQLTDKIGFYNAHTLTAHQGAREEGMAIADYYAIASRAVDELSKKFFSRDELKAKQFRQQMAKKTIIESTLNDGNLDISNVLKLVRSPTRVLWNTYFCDGYSDLKSIVEKDLIGMSNEQKNNLATEATKLAGVRINPSDFESMESLITALRCPLDRSKQPALSELDHTNSIIKEVLGVQGGRYPSLELARYVHQTQLDQIGGFNQFVTGITRNPARPIIAFTNPTNPL